MVFVQADQSSGHDHHDHHDHAGDKKEDAQQIGGRLTLPNLKDCTNSKVFSIHVPAFFMRWNSK